jgi:heterocycloanthracin/sonorensin family bacteriocin
MGDFKKDLQKLSVDDYKEGEVTPWDHVDQDIDLAQFGRCGGRCGGGCFRRCGGCGCGGCGGCGCGGCFPFFPFFPFGACF